MRRRLAVSMLVLAFVSLAGPAVAAPMVVGCASAGSYGKDLSPRERGPARLRSVHCLELPKTRLSTTAPEVSPDGRAFFVYQYGIGLHLGALTPNGAKADFPLDPTFRSIQHRSDTVFAWAADSRSVWGATQEFLLPSHFATSPLQPVRANRDGKLTPLPAISHEAGGLDGVLWIGGRGLALAEFGSRGGFYRPERPNPEPTFAIIDASQGKLLKTLAFRDLEPLLDLKGAELSYAMVGSAAGAMTPEGRPRVVLKLGVRDWIVWTHGERPRSLALPHDQGSADIAMNADGDRLLVATNLRPSGMICERNPRCPAPTPVEGVVAVLYDLPSGRTMWSIKRTVSKFMPTPPPAISPDGRFALVGIQPETGAWPHAALVAMKDGRILQTIRAPYSSTNSMGFSNDGRTAWISGGHIVALYDLGR